MSKNETKELPLEVRKAKLKAELEAERRQRVADCEAAINQVLSEHDCTLDLAMVVRRDSVELQITIIANDLGLVFLAHPGIH